MSPVKGSFLFREIYIPLYEMFIKRGGLMLGGKQILAVLFGEALVAGLIFGVRRYGEHQFNLGRIEGLLDGAASVSDQQ